MGTDMSYSSKQHEHAHAERLSGNERFAQLLAYLSPYLFWGTVCTLTGGIWLLQ